MPKPVQPPADEREAEKRRVAAQLGEIIARLGHERGLTAERIALRSGLTIYKLHAIKNRNTDPSLNTLLSLCGGLRVTPETLLGELPVPLVPQPSRPLPSAETQIKSPPRKREGRDHATR